MELPAWHEPVVHRIPLLQLREAGMTTNYVALSKERVAAERRERMVKQIKNGEIRVHNIKSLDDKTRRRLRLPTEKDTVSR